MKKFTLLALTFVLIAALFTGCRRNPETTGSTATSSTSTAPATKPTTKPTTKPAETTRPDGTGVLPDATDLMPDMTDGTTGTGTPRGHRGPRY